MRDFFNNPHIKSVYEYHMDKLEGMADSVGLGEYYQKIRFLTDIGILFWGLGYTVDRLIENDMIYKLLMNFATRFDSYSQE